MLVNIREFYAAVTGKDYNGNTEKAVAALKRWGIPTVVPSNLPAGARKHRRVDVSLLDKAKSAYAAEQLLESALPAKANGHESNLTTFNTLRRIESKLDRLLAELGVRM